ncbi:MAG: ferritin-like domain-containing protein [Candidatus Methylacidiphilales bacterium]|nr:ferritin-like domain-containing protein [Candidatus Methylacidiphilales bacterium]
MSKLNTLEQLLVHELKDLYSAETQLVKALPKMAKAATSPKLKAGFEKHLAETEVHVTRLEEIMEKLGASPRGKSCAAMKGLVEEGSETIAEDAEAAVKDAALIAAAQRVEHYEIAGYGTARTFAQLLGHKDVAKTLQTTLDEEGATDHALTKLAQTINVDAMAGVD